MSIAMAQMHREHAAWLGLVRALENASASLNLNDEKGLHAAIVLWGEELAHLRMTQDREVWEVADAEARELVLTHIGHLPF
jgi:hypothetical protein